MGQRTDWFIEHNPGMIEDFLKLGCSSVALMGGEVRFSANINRVQVGPIVKATRGQPEFIWLRGLKNLQRLPRVCAVKCDFCAYCGEVVELHDRVLRESFIQLFGQCV